MKKNLNLNSSDFFFLAALALFTMVVFCRTFHAAYVYWDDNVFILENALLKEPFWTAVKAFFSNYYHADYLPLPLTTYWLEVHFFGTNAGLQHGVNLFLHLGNIFLLYVFLSLLGMSKSWVRILCFLFAVHPVQTEPLMWMSNRNIFMCTLFLFGACCAAQRDRFFLLSVCYLCAFFCKSAGILLPLLLVAADFCYRGKTLWKSVKTYLPLLAVAAVAVYLRTIAYSNGVEQNFSAVALDPHRLKTLPIEMLNALAIYMKMLVVPWGYSIIYPKFSLNGLTVLGAVVTVSVMALLFFLWRRSRRPDYIFFSVLILVFLLPVLQILPRINYINDRYLYIPIIGFGGLFLAAWEDLTNFWQGMRLRPVQNWGRVLGFAFLVVLPFFTFMRSAAWVTDKGLWEDTVRKNPRSVLAINNLGLAFQRQGDLDDAVGTYREAIAIGNVDGALSTVYNNLGTIYSSPESGKYYDLHAAAQSYADGLGVCIKREDTYTLLFNLAVAENALNDKQKSIQTLNFLAGQLQSLSDRKYDGLLQLTLNTVKEFQDTP